MFLWCFFCSQHSKLLKTNSESAKITHPFILEREATSLKSPFLFISFDPFLHSCRRCLEPFLSLSSWVEMKLCSLIVLFTDSFASQIRLFLMMMIWDGGKNEQETWWSHLSLSPSSHSKCINLIHDLKMNHLHVTLWIQSLLICFENRTGFTWW